MYIYAYIIYVHSPALSFIYPLYPLYPLITLYTTLIFSSIYGISLYVPCRIPYKILNRVPYSQACK